jgi:hypothetical protein
MRGFCLVLVLASTPLAAANVHAQGRPDSLSMTCAQAQALVRSSGAIVIGSGPILYERYVTGSNFCNPEEEARPAWTPTADVRQCMIGYRCVEVDADVR